MRIGANARPGRPQCAARHRRVVSGPPHGAHPTPAKPPPTITAVALSAVWVIPGLSLREQVVGRGRAPGPPCVRVQRGDVPQDRVHHPPGGLDRVLPGEQPLLAVERRADEPVVGPHVRAGLLREDPLVDLRLQPRPLLLARDREPHLRLRPDAEPEGVHALERVEAEDVLGWPAEPEGDLGRGDRHALASADEDRHALPAPGIGGEPDRDERFDRRARGDARDVAVALVLTAHDPVRFERAQRPDQARLGVAQVRQPAERGVGQHGGEHLEHVVLEDVADRAGLVVEVPAARDVEVLRHGDLDALDVRPVEQRLEHAVGEAREQHVLGGVQAEPVVDPVDGLLREDGVHGGVQLPRAAQVGAERLLDHDPGALGQAGLADPLGDRREQRRRHLEVEQRPPALGEPGGQGLVGGVVGEVAVDVLEQVQHPLGDVPVRVDAVVPQGLGGVAPELLELPSALCDADDGDLERTALDQPHQRRERLQLGEVPGRAEDDERIDRVCSGGCHIASCRSSGWLAAGAGSASGGRRRGGWSPSLRQRPKGPASPWVTSRTERSPASCHRSSSKASAVPASRCAVGSSRTSTEGSARKARASARRWRWPPDSSLPRSPTTVSRPAGSDATHSPSRACARASRISASDAPGRANATFSRIVESKMCGSWPLRSTAARTWSGPRATATSRSETEASSGRGGVSTGSSGSVTSGSRSTSSRTRRPADSTDGRCRAAADSGRTASNALMPTSVSGATSSGSSAPRPVAAVVATRTPRAVSPLTATPRASAAPAAPASRSAAPTRARSSPRMVATARASAPFSHSSSPASSTSTRSAVSRARRAAWWRRERAATRAATTGGRVAAQTRPAASAAPATGEATDTPVTMTAHDTAATPRGTSRRSARSCMSSTSATMRLSSSPSRYASSPAGASGSILAKTAVRRRPRERNARSCDASRSPYRADGRTRATTRTATMSTVSDRMGGCWAARQMRYPARPARADPAVTARAPRPTGRASRAGRMPSSPVSRLSTRAEDTSTCQPSLRRATPRGPPSPPGPGHG